MTPERIEEARAWARGNMLLSGVAFLLEALDANDALRAELDALRVKFDKDGAALAKVWHERDRYREALLEIAGGDALEERDTWYEQRARKALRGEEEP